MIVVFSLVDWLFQSMFRSGERTFRSGERMFRSGERTFRSGEHKWKAASVQLQITIMANSSWLSWLTNHGSCGKLMRIVKKMLVKSDIICTFAVKSKHNDHEKNRKSLGRNGGL